MEVLNIHTDRQQLTDVEVGDDVKIYHFVNLYGCRIGSGSRVGSFVEIQKDVRIGRNCKISSHSFLCSGVEIGDGVFIGHGVMFTNDRYPRATRPDGTPQDETDWTLIRTVIGNQVSIGSNATILPGIQIGDQALIGAGSVVTRDVPANSVVAGNPARVIRNNPNA